MTVHMVRVFCEPPKGEAQTAIDNWVQNYSEWTADSVAHSLTETTTPSGTQYLQGDWRFVDQGETPTNILQDLSTRLEQLQGGLWHRLLYEVCPHDEDNVTQKTNDTFVATLGSTATLSHNRLQRRGEIVTEVGGDGTTYTRDDYNINTHYGEITPITDGDMVGGQEYVIAYEYYESGGPCAFVQKVESDTAIPADIPNPEVV